MNLQEAMDFIHCTDWKGSRLGLDRMRELMERLGNPQRQLKFIHVAGTNGKGSTCAMLSAILTAAGLRTGRYTSPHLLSLNERMNIDGRDIADRELIETVRRVKAAAEVMKELPTEFELITATAFCWFQERSCDLVVLEVGLGGRLDATNVIDAPEAAVITKIGLDHTEILGDTLEKIAAEKAGIIKAGCGVAVYQGPPEVRRVFASACKERGACLRLARFEDLALEREDLDRQVFSWRDSGPLELRLIGEHQRFNAVTALEAVELLRERGWRISREAVRSGLRQAAWPGRFEVLSRHPLVILDGAHNPQGIAALERSLRTFLPERPVTFLIGALADKDYRRMLDRLALCAKNFVCLTPDSPRALAADTLAALLRERGRAAEACGSAEQGLRRMLETAEGGPAVICGSLYLAGEVRRRFRPVLREWQRQQGIRARRAIPPEERAAWDRAIVEGIAGSAAFRQARTVMSYAAVRGEVDLGELHALAERQGKRLAFPYCAGGGEMTALAPRGAASWTQGRYGIPTPVPEESEPVAPGEIDLVLCPCTAFDRQGNRMGMGGGYYDRFLPKCERARICAAAYGVQACQDMVTESWDRPMDLVFTEKGSIAAAGEA